MSATFNLLDIPWFFALREQGQVFADCLITDEWLFSLLMDNDIENSSICTEY